MLNDLSPQLWLLGVRNYFLYMPLAFIVARTFERDDIQRLARLVALLAVPIAFICVKQSFSPRGDWLNVGAGGALPPTFARWPATHHWCARLRRATRYVYRFYLEPARCSLSWCEGCQGDNATYCLPVVVATFVMMVVSGSRGIWFQAAGVGLVTASSFFLSRARTSKRLRAIIVPLAGGLVVAALFSTLLFRECLQRRMNSRNSNRSVRFPARPPSGSAEMVAASIYVRGVYWRSRDWHRHDRCCGLFHSTGRTQTPQGAAHG